MEFDSHIIEIDDETGDAREVKIFFLRRIWNDLVWTWRLRGIRNPANWTFCDWDDIERRILELEKEDMEKKAESRGN